MHMMQLTNFLQILHARRMLAAAVFGAVLLAALALILFMPRAYTARVSLVTDAKGIDPITGTALPVPTLDSVMATEADIIKSHNVALKVVDKLRLESDPVLQRQYLKKTGGVGTMRDWIADKLLDGLDVVPSRESSVINVDVTAADSQVAAARANAFAEAYMQAGLELKMDPARRQAAWFQDQVRDLRSAVESAQTRLSDYQRRSGLAGTDDKDNRLDVENARLAEISTELVTAQATLADARSRLNQVGQARQKGQLEQLPDLVGNALLQTLKTDLARAESNFADVSQRYDRNAPPYQSAAAQVVELKRKVAAELNTAIGSIRQLAEISQQRTKELQRSLDAQKARILQLKQKRDALSILTRDADNAQKSYDAAMQRSGSVKLESQLNQSSVAVLNAAIPPNKPSHPRPLLYSLVSLILGGLLGVGAAVMAELLDRRVHSIRDLAALPDLVVLAEIPRLLDLSPQAI